MHDCNVIVAANNVAKRGEALFYALDFDFGWKRVAQVLQFLVCGGCGDEKTVAVTEGEILAFVFFLVKCFPSRQKRLFGLVERGLVVSDSPDD